MYTIQHTNIPNVPAAPSMFSSADKASDYLALLARTVGEFFDGGVVSYGDTCLKVHKDGRVVFAADVVKVSKCA